MRVANKLARNHKQLGYEANTIVVVHSTSQYYYLITSDIALHLCFEIKPLPNYVWNSRDASKETRAITPVTLISNAPIKRRLVKKLIARACMPVSRNSAAKSGQNILSADKNISNSSRDLRRGAPMFSTKKKDSRSNHKL